MEKSGDSLTSNLAIVRRIVWRALRAEYLIRSVAGELLKRAIALWLCVRSFLGSTGEVA
jgi:hypothetical protein